MDLEGELEKKIRQLELIRDAEANVLDVPTKLALVDIRRQLEREILEIAREILRGDKSEEEK